MGEKRRAKSKNKTVKPSRNGLRPHEQREQESAYKSAGTQGVPSTPAAKPPRP